MTVDLPPLPRRMTSLRRDHRGYPVPWFVKWIDGKPDFRIADDVKRITAVNRHLCWVCGQSLGVHYAFVIGPMCAINRVSAEPPSHRDCALFSARACPFLVRPKMHRVIDRLPETAVEPPGIFVDRNPGVTLVWVTRGYSVNRTGAGVNDWLIEIGDPDEALWFASGRMATQAEITDSIVSGLPLLRGIAAKEGAGSVGDLERLIAKRCAELKIVPPEAS